jgi:hypothetical protein
MPERNLNSMAVKLLSGGLALILWAFVTWERPAERRVSVPVSLVNLDTEMTSSGVPQFVDVVVSGPWLPVMIMRPNALAIKLDLAGAGEGITVFPGMERRLPLPEYLKVARISPARIEVRLMKRER